MAKKVLKVPFPEKCIGCELCVFAAQRQLKRAGVSGAPIKILNSQKGYDIHLDPSVNDLDTKKIADICPRGCYSVEEVADAEAIDFKLEEDDKS